MSLIEEMSIAALSNFILPSAMVTLLLASRFTFSKPIRWVAPFGGGGGGISLGAVACAGAAGLASGWAGVAAGAGSDVCAMAAALNKSAASTILYRILRNTPFTRGGNPT